MVKIFDVTGQHVQSVDVGGDFSGKHALDRSIGQSQISGGTGTVCGSFKSDALRVQIAAGLRQKHHMGADMFNLIQRHTGTRHQGDAHAYEGFSDNMQATLRQQAVNIGDPPVGGVFNRQHRKVCTPLTYGADHPFEGGAGDGNHPRAGL